MMTNTPIFKDLHFHDSSLDEIYVEGSTVRMVFESVNYPPLETEQDDYPLISLTLWIDGVDEIVENNQQVQTLAISGSFGDVLKLELTGRKVALAVSWCDFKPGMRNEFSTISMSGPNLTVRCGPYAYQSPETQ